MLLASCRKELADEEELGNKFTFWDVSLDSAGDVDNSPLSSDEFREELKGKSVLTLVHGYNNQFLDVARAYEIIEQKAEHHIGDYYDRVVGFTWPGGDGPLDWYSAKRRAGIVAARFGWLLDYMGQFTDCIDTMSHSLGARVTMKALTELAPATVRYNFLLASAVDNESIEAGEAYHAALHAVDGSIVFHSKHDDVLRFAYSAAEWDYALGYLGPENPGDLMANAPTCYVANCKRVIGGHGQYKYTDAVYSFIAEWIDADSMDQFVTL